MIKQIVKDIFFLNQKSALATKADAYIADDLIDTLKANAESCVGLAANMIGYKKCVIAFSMGPFFIAMFNPKIIEKSQSFETSEGCLSLEGIRNTLRYENIKVEYLDKNFQKKTTTYSGFTAQIIQHEIDHCNGIII